MVVRYRFTKTIGYHVFAMVLAVLMIYPVLWMVSSSFKSQAGIFRGGLSLIPEQWVFENFAEGWKGFGRQTFTTFFKNSIIITTFSTLGAVASSAFIAFGFARVRFAGNRLWFAVMIATLLLPFEIKMIPQYLLFHRLGWVNTFLPMIVPSSLGGSAFFIFLIVQFMRTIPFELDESAYVDGCGRFRIFWSIILPLSKPALMTAAIFSFYWSWNNFIQPLLYLSKPKLYTVSVALRLFADPTSVTNWGAMFSMATLSLLPVMAVFLILQRHIVEGISSTGLKG
jgi:multiple sugar transport system permease protein